uniref:response regulator transcription factor n=1 Tax=Novosphingobium sp. TaxID=1874826 RepID=UPI00356508E6
MARILLVEDDSSLARGLVSLLRSEGFAADAVNSAEEALEIEAGEPYQLLILDVGLPGMR